MAYVRLTDWESTTRTGAEVDAVVALSNGPGVWYDLPALPDAVTRGDLEGLLSDFYTPDALSAAAIGKDEDVFREALGAVDAELAAA